MGVMERMSILLSVVVNLLITQCHASTTTSTDASGTAFSSLSSIALHPCTYILHYWRPDSFPDTSWFHDHDMLHTSQVIIVS